MIELTDQEFVILRDYVVNHYGIDLTKKRILIQGRLATTLQELGFTNYTDYIQLVMNDTTGNQVNHLLNKLTTNLTYFMREKEHFEFVRNRILPEFDATGRHEIRLWSAGCSSGEEPYTLAMTVLDYYAGKQNVPKISILASDISQRVLEQARAGVYPAEALKDLPLGWEAQYFERLPTGEYRVKEFVQQLVTFKTVNLMDSFLFTAPFEVIFCRNVMIYFEKQRKLNLINRFYRWVRPDFYFIISHSENIDRSIHGFHMVKPSIFYRGD